MSGIKIRASVWRVMLVVCGVLTGPAMAAYVTPQMGGGQVGMMSASMKHADVFFDGVNLSVHVDDTVPTPSLRPLVSPDEFDPAQPWSVLSGKAYNFQYAWNPGGFITLPAGGAIWIERLSHDAGLGAFLRPPATPSYAPVFVADGDRWKWSGAMTHNAYAVLNPTASLYTARYRVYIGHADTGAPLAGYGDEEVTWTWQATAVPEPAWAGLLLTALASVLRCRRR